MRPSQRTGLAIGVGLIVAVLVLNGADGLRQARQMHLDSYWVAHTHEVLETLALVLSHVNDGGFWLVKEYFNMTVPQTFRTWTIVETIISVAALILVLLASLIVG